MFFGFFVDTAILIQNNSSNRTLQTLVKKSEVLPLSRGVPQGSIVGPLLFRLRINDFHQLMPNCHLYHYADDTRLYFSFKFQGGNSSQHDINSDLRVMFDVSASHRLKII